MPAPNPTLAVIFGELILSSYPILIKTVDTNLYSQLLARFLVFPTLALVFGPLKDFTSIWTSPYEAFVGVMNGFLNLGHVLVSYISFKLLPAGTAISLFYLYPIFNLILGSLLLGEKLPIQTILIVIIALIGTYMITTSHIEKDDIVKRKKDIQGIIMALLAALTETAIFLFVKSNDVAMKSPFYTINSLYPSGLALLGLAGTLTSKNIMDTSSINWSKLIGFNAILGFTGYLARFYAIPRVSTIVFSVLSFIGVISAYTMGVLFAGDQVSSRGITGGLLIASSIAALRYFSII